MRFLLVALGSAGDIHPLLRIARELARRGHRVTFFTNEIFRERVEAVPGVELAPTGNASAYRELGANPDLFHRWRGPRLTFGFLARSLREVVEALCEHLEPGRTVMVASSLALAPRLVQEAHGVPLATAHIYPGVLRSVHRMPRLPFGNPPRWGPRWLKRLTWWLADLYLDPLFQPWLDQERHRLGLPPVRRVLHRWWHSPELVIGLFPAWFAEPQPDWPQQMVLTGFPLQEPGGNLGGDLLDWLEAGEAPIVWTAGTAQWHGAEFFANAVEVCRRLGRRGVLVTTARTSVPDPLPPGVIHHYYLPFGEVLPRAAALVHHGGIGTTAQAFAAAVPQLVVPWAYDQFDNGHRVERLGAGGMLDERPFHPGRSAVALAQLLGSHSVKERCRELARRVHESNPVREACDLLEQLPVGS